VARLRAQLLEAIGTVGETEAARLEADAALKAWVRAEFGVESTEAIDFGFAPTLAALAKASGTTTRTAARYFGYENVSAFIAMFRRVTGETPGKYLARALPLRAGTAAQGPQSRARGAGP
jgi:AraC-like DNA-binding protein